MKKTTFCYFFRTGFFFSTKQWYLSIARAKPLYSERYGYRKPLIRVGSWRIFTGKPFDNNQQKAK